VPRASSLQLTTGRSSLNSLSRRNAEVDYRSAIYLPKKGCCQVTIFWPKQCGGQPSSGPSAAIDSTAFWTFVVQAEASNSLSLPTGSHLPDAGSLRDPGFTSKGEVRPISLPICCNSGRTSLPSSVTQRWRSAGGIGPSSQNEKIPGRRTSRMCRSFLTRVFGVPVIIWPCFCQSG